MITVRLPEDVEKRLIHLSQITKRSRAFYVREALIEYLNDLEDLYIAEKRLADYRTGKNESIPLEEVMKEYGLEV